MTTTTTTVASTTEDDKKKKKKTPKPSASASETLSFVFACGPNVTVLFLLGVLGGMCNGLVYPALAYLFSSSFVNISAATEDNALAGIRDIAYKFLVVGVVALVAAACQTFFLECAAHHATQSLRLQWFSSLLRQDSAFFDLHDVSGIASSLGPAAIKYQRGIGRKLGDGIQFFTTGVGGFAYGFYSSWKVALLVLAFLPVVSMMALSVVTLNQTRSARAAKYYGRAASVAYTTVSEIRTVLALNAVPEMIRQYTLATQDAFDQAVQVVFKEGLANGGMLGSFMVLYGILVLFGSYLLYSDIADTGCDPSGGVLGNQTCSNAGSDVFGAMLGIMFAAQGISQVGNCTEAFTEARTAAYSALLAINRKPGTPSETVYKTDEEIEAETTKSTRSITNHSSENFKNTKDFDPRIKAVLPKYEIDSFGEGGAKPTNVQGRLEFKDIRFHYPTRPHQPILNGLSVSVPAGKTIALVGPSGGGKSTIVSMLERFYDPTSGSVEIDGTNIKDINVHHLRSLIGYVGQEPTLFNDTVGKNIAYGNPSATQEQIEAAARMANAHDFISSFPQGYDTHVGDKGSQLSGGQKQRIAIARVLVGNPSILLLDEATSALDSESELVVQDALDNVLSHRNLTTVVIAHRLSTIRNADIIAVIVKGRIVETGTHEELMLAETGYYRNLVEKQEGPDRGSSLASSRNSSSNSLAEMDADDQNTNGNNMNGESINKPMGAPVLEFKGVQFAYPTRPNKKIFAGFDLAIHRGETVALVGPSGGGKSTTVQMIERFYDPSEGSVEYLGTDLKLLNITWYRDQIGFVGQEPTLFNETIAKNIAYGSPSVSQKEIEEAARQANAHNFIKSFPEGYDTSVGERGGQLSGGQKQRVAIARALVKKPKVLILDEATSALDSESETIVQAALDKLMQSREHTTLVIAHRLSTIANADKIAFIAEGKVLEYGTPAELLQKKHGRYKRLVESQKRGATLEALLAKQKKDDTIEEEEEEEVTKTEDEAEEIKSFDSKRARELASPDAAYMALGSVGAVMAGGVFPIWGILFAQTIDLLFRRVEACPDPFSGNVTAGYLTCEDYWTDFADDMQQRSFEVGAMWGALLLNCLIGFTLMFVGFGRASERLSKRVRNDAFTALCRQEIAFFDKRSVGKITSELQDDAARIHAFSGVPIRSALLALASVVTGLVLSFVYMWPFALLALFCIPLMAFGSSMEMKKVLGEDEGTGDGDDQENSPGGIVVETLLNMRTVAALTLEKPRFEKYKIALENSNPNYVWTSFQSGFVSGLSMFIQQWINALQFWWGGWLLVNYPSSYILEDFLISNFALLFGMFGLGSAFQDLADRKEVEKSAARIFHLMDRESAIDPLSEAGTKLDSRKSISKSVSNGTYKSPNVYDPEPFKKDLVNCWTDEKGDIVETSDEVYV
ncbi:Leptomycin B resistance protein pmd1 [Seminavis robusta]|uniref:Leptomycin B resistance protein pmd1 n=1 Tax=Seminavis robusta TaxID=568900 RepID=A0A9N8EQU4_9STRA|nr:Leptomycin B resistance protein pmd1 [Seminavis robusta]|eukprot:Sro1631_g287230.1 Leptomycin B resistance protein pmd1 (1416) ;mRNA; f:4737-10480